MVSKAVLFAPADVPGSRETPPRSSRPLSSRLALLPVGNRPLVLHALEELIEAGIGEVAVVSSPTIAEEVRKVLILRHIAGLTPPEIAAVLGKTESSVHGLHHRGRAAPQAALRELDAAPVTAVA